MEAENIRKQFKISQSIWKILWCIENANTYKHSVKISCGNLF